jgi:hypothetical protein
MVFRQQLQCYLQTTEMAIVKRERYWAGRQCLTSQIVSEPDSSVSGRNETLQVLAESCNIKDIG